MTMVVGRSRCVFLTKTGQMPSPAALRWSEAVIKNKEILTYGGVSKDFFRFGATLA